MNIRDQHLKSCKSKAIKFVKSGEIKVAIEFLEKELSFFKESKNKNTLEDLNNLTGTKGETSKEEIIKLIKLLN